MKRGEFLRIKYHTRLQWRQNSCATKWTEWVGWIAQAYSSKGPSLGYWVIHPLSVLPSVPTSPPWNTHQTLCKSCKPCTKQDTCSTIIPCIIQRGVMSSLKTSSWNVCWQPYLLSQRLPVKTCQSGQPLDRSWTCLNLNSIIDANWSKH